MEVSTLRQRQINLMRKYADKIKTVYDFRIRGDISEKQLRNARDKFAPGLDEDYVIGFYDTTIRGNGKNGYLFTDTKVYYLELLEKPKKLWYEDIRSMEITKNNKKDCNKVLHFELKNRDTFEWASCDINKTPLKQFFEEMIVLIEEEQSLRTMESERLPTLRERLDQNKRQRLKEEQEKYGGASTAGIIYSNVSNASSMYYDDKLATPRGHGFAAENANHLADLYLGKDAKIVGNDNAKNGADRVVDGVSIQSKYCASGAKCVQECFDGGNFRYWNMDGSPMQIEVPSDMYDSAIQAMENRICRGEVSGITDPAEAKNIIRKGHFTYAQAKNIAKAGKVESIMYDAASGAVIARNTFGITAMLSFATAVWTGESMDVAIRTSVAQGLRIGGLQFLSAVLAGQLSKAGLNSLLVESSDAVVSLIGPKASAVLINAFRGGSNIYGAAAMKSASKMIRGNFITSLASFTILSTGDISNIFRRRISGGQFIKNLCNTGASLIGGAGGWGVGATVGAAVGSVIPVVGTAVGAGIGALLGGFGGGSIASKVSSVALDKFIEDDANIMLEIIQEVFTDLAGEYLLTQKEAEKIVDRIREELDGKKLKDMFASNDRRKFARNFLEEYCEKETSCRRHITLPTEGEMRWGLRRMLEDISDEELETANA